MQIGLCDAQGEAVSIRYVSLIQGDMGTPTPLDLADALPLEDLLAPVQSCKDMLSHAIEALEPDSLPATEASLESGSKAPPRLTRGFGATLQVQKSSPAFRVE